MSHCENDDITGQAITIFPKRGRTAIGIHESVDDTLAIMGDLSAVHGQKLEVQIQYVATLSQHIMAFGKRVALKVLKSETLPLS